ncbi:MAG: hypothetical protein WBP93_05265 [Pyrinomonadaceae bacterium]
MSDELNLLLKFIGDNTQARMSSAELREALGKDTAEIVKTAKVGSSEIAKAIQEAAIKSSAAVELSTKQQKSAIESLQRQRSTALIQQLKEAENAVERSGRGVNQLSSYTDKIIAQSQKAISEAKQSALGAEHSITNVTGALSAAEKEATSFGAGIGAIAGPLGIAAGATTVLAGATISLGGALFSLTDRTSAYGDEIYRAHLRTQLTTESLSALRLVAGENKVEFNQVVSAIDRYLKNVDEARLGNKKLYTELTELGINVERAARNPQEAVSALIKAWSELAPTTDRNQAAIKLLGKAGDVLIPTLDALHGSLDQAQQKSKELGQMWSEEDAARAHEFVVSLQDLEAQALGLASTIGRQVAPEIIRDIRDLSNWLKDNRNSWEEWGNTARRVALGVRIELGFIKDILAGDVVGAGIHASVQLAASEINARASAASQNTHTDGGARTLTRDDTKEREKAAKEALKLAQEDAHARLKVLDDANKEAERIYKEETEALKREYELRRISLRDYLAQEEEAARKNFEIKLAELAEEKSIVEQTIAKAAERKSRLADIALKERTVRAEFNKKLLDDQFEIEQKELRMESEHRASLLDIASTRDSARIAALRDFGNQRIVAQQEVESRIIEIETDGLNRQQLNLIDQLRLAGQNKEQQQKVNDDLAKLAVQRVAHEEESVRRLQQARQTDLENLRQYRANLQALLLDTHEAELENQRQTLEGVRTYEDLKRAEQSIGVGFEITQEKDRQQEQLEALRFRQKLRQDDIQDKINAAREKQRAAAFDKQIAEQQVRDANDTIAATQRQIAENKDLLKSLTDDKQILEVKASIAEMEKDIAGKRKEVADAQTAFNRAEAAGNQARRDAAKAQGEITELIKEGAQQQQEAIKQNADKLDELYQKRDAVIVTGERVRLATRQELIKLEFDLEDRAAELRTQRNKAALTNQKEAFEAERRTLTARRDALLDVGDLEGANALLKRINDLTTQVEAANRRLEAEDDRYTHEVERNKKRRDETLERDDPSSRRSRFGDVYADTYKSAKKQVDNAGKPISNLKASIIGLAATAKESFEQMSADAGNMTTMLGGAFGSLVQGLGQTAEAFLVTGEFSGKALAKMLTQTLAHLAIESGIKALYEIAAGYASLAIYDYKAATEHFTAATFYGQVAAISAGAALIGSFAFGLRGGGKGSDAAAAGGAMGYGGGDNGPQYQPFNYGNQNISASQAFGDGSRATGVGNMMLAALNRVSEGQRRVVASNQLVADRISALHSKIDSIPGDELIRKNPHAVGDGLQEAINSYHPVARDITSLGSTGRT